jgi:hypothetical protein
VLSSEIDISRLNKCAAFCEDNHEGVCHGAPGFESLPAASSLIFLGVQNHCLVQTSRQIKAKYITLSYVWGQTLGKVKLKKSNVNELKQKKSLINLQVDSCIPKTILDAINLTRAMNIPYLWVDRLCIIQDEPTHMTLQLSQMASIYTNSYFTIVAADGPNADFGLPGSGPHPPRRCLDLSFEFKKALKLAIEFTSESKDSPWPTCAWTFQERALSRRTLVFADNTVYWNCRSVVWYENRLAEPDQITTNLDSSKDNGFRPGHPLSLQVWPDLKLYFAHVKEYSSRNLILETDAANAFAAMTTSLSRTFPKGFFFGIPEFFFDIGILWIEAEGARSLKRREYFPSWSWLVWSTEVWLSMICEAAWRPDSHEEYRFRFQPVCQWSIISEGASSRLIDNSYHKYERSVPFSHHLMPVGWSLTEDARSVRHGSLQGQTFKFPVPIYSW